MNNVYLTIFHALLKTEIFKKYYEYIDQDFLKVNYPEYYKIYLAIKELHKEEKDYTVDDLEVAFYTLYPATKSELLEPLFTSLRGKSESDNSTVEGLLSKIKASAIATELADVWVRISNAPLDSELSETAFSKTEVYKSCEKPVEAGDDIYADLDFENIINAKSTQPGLKWRLQSLNDALGPVCPGDFGIIFARPESGKTTFLADEMGFFIQQIAERQHIRGTSVAAAWFNNEERKNKVISRIYQGILGKSTTELLRNPKKSREEFVSALHGKPDALRFIDGVDITKQHVEKILAKEKFDLVIFDQLDKIEGFKADRKDLEHKARYIWARNLAKKHNCVVIGVCQASVSGENQKWLTMEDMDESKTSKSAEADFILGIGALNEGPQNIRYFHLSKNKTDQPIDESKRHGKWAVKIRPEIARYEDF